ncbi:hypothetical protein B0H14DRAFT_3721321 [Mycena olivaceomarginata]|nr:hypothetical protein B0H14DRAFT_3721321 [Mycena olivaceomarginata]
MASPASRKRLHDLVEDVLIVILIECDVAGVLALSEVGFRRSDQLTLLTVGSPRQTSRFFHHLALTNTVWHSLVTELVQRGFIDRRSDDEDLKDLSTEQLIGIVKRMLHGPKAWADIPSKPSPVVARRPWNLSRESVRKPAVEAAAPLGEAKRIVLHPEIAQDPMPPFLDIWDRSKLLPGGKYVLFLNSARLECWSVFEDRLVWKHTPSTMDHTSVIGFEVEMVECELAVIGTCQRIDPGKLFVEITTVNFTTGVSDLELVSRVPEEPFDFDSVHIECVVCGHTVAVYLRLRSRVLLINWRTSSRILISAKNIENSQIGVIPDYLVVTLVATHGEHRLAFSPFASIAFWEPNFGARRTTFFGGPTSL